jgi:uncharacterized protein (DUF4415 family)
MAATRRQTIEGVAYLIYGEDLDADQCDARNGGRGGGWTFDTPGPGPDQHNSWTRHAGVYLSAADMADARELAARLTAGEQDARWPGPRHTRRRPMGRPRQHPAGSRRRVTLELPADLLARIEASGETLTDYITAALADKLERDA